MNRYIGVSALALMLLAAIPYFASTYLVSLINSILVLALTSLSFSLIYSNTGYMNLGHSVFYGVGGYAFAFALNRSLPAPLAAVLSLAAVFVVATASSVFMIRLRGAYYVIGTLALVLLAHSLAYNLGWLTGGYQGMIINVGQGAAYWAYYLLTASTSLLLILMQVFRSSPIGYKVRSMKGDDIAARTLGIDVAEAKISVLLLGSVFAGLAGMLSIFYNGFISPDSAFGVSITFLPIIMAILLGSKSVLGPLFGVIIIALAAETFSTILPQLTHLMLGILLTFVALYPPKNLLGLENLLNLTRGVKLEGKERTA